MGINHVLKIPNQLCAVPQVTIVGPNVVPHVFTSEPSTFTSDPVGRPYVGFKIDNSAHLGHALFRPQFDSRFIAGAYNRMANINYEAGRYEKALEWLEQAHEALPNNPALLFNLGQCNLKLARPEQAIPFFKRYLEYDRSSAYVHFFLAHALDETGQQEKSIDSFKKAICHSDDPDLKEAAYYNLGYIYDDMGEYDKAANAYNKALDINPDNSEAYYNLGVIAFELDCQEEAEGLFKIAINQQPDDVDSRYALGALCYEQRRYADAARQFEYLLVLDSTHVNAQIYLGIISFLTEEWEQVQERLSPIHKTLRRDLDFKKAEVIEVIMLLAQAGSYYKKREWEAVRVCLQSAADKIESGGRKELAERLRNKSVYIGKIRKRFDLIVDVGRRKLAERQWNESVYIGERRKLFDLIGGVGGELVGDFVKDIGLSDSLGLYNKLKREQDTKLKQLFLNRESLGQFRSESAKLRSDTRARGRDVKRKALELFHQQYDRLHRHTPLGLPPERQIYPASRFFSGLIGNVFYNGAIRDGVEQRLGFKPAKLSAGINYFDVPQALLTKIIESLSKKSLDKYYQDYTHPFGGDEVRKSIADYENARAGSRIYTEDNVAITLGATGAIFFAFKFLEELRRRTGQRMDVLIPVPTYYVYGSIASQLQFGVEEIVSSESGHRRFMPTPAEIEARLRRNGNIKMIALANPNNPTGEIYSHEELEEIVALAKSHDSYILYDEIFSDLMLTEESFPNIATIAREQNYLDHVMRVTSWSKDRCIPGFRVGYLVADEAVLSVISELPEWQYANPPTVLNGVIERDLTYRQMMESGQEGDKDFRRYKADLQNNDARYRENLRIINERLADTRRFTILQPKAAFNMFVRLNEMEEYDQWDFAKQLFVEKGVEVHPGPGFGLDQYDWETKHGFWIRISFAIEKKELVRGLDGLLEFIEECMRDSNKVKGKTPRA